MKYSYFEPQTEIFDKFYKSQMQMSLYTYLAILSKICRNKIDNPRIGMPMRINKTLTTYSQWEIISNLTQIWVAVIIIIIKKICFVSRLLIDCSGDFNQFHTILSTSGAETGFLPTGQTIFQSSQVWIQLTANIHATDRPINRCDNCHVWARHIHLHFIYF